MRIANQESVTKVFLALVKSGLWETEALLSSYGEVDYKEIYRLSEEQAVVGLVAAGLEHVHDVKVPKNDALTFAGASLQIEQRNVSMNVFIKSLIENLRKADIYTLLLKGQGLAQCYERPLWRSCGDVDLFLSESNYEAAKKLLMPIATEVEEESSFNRHLGLTINSVVVELHGKLRGGLWWRIDHELDKVQDEVFLGGAVRSWLNDNTQVFIPAVNQDVIYVFSHILQHFFQGGIGLRQVCDWCRLLWKYRGTINKLELESRIKSLGAMTEWRAFAFLAVNYLGMPQEAMPLYISSKKWEKKADKIMGYILKVGNFGYNRDKSYMYNDGALKRKVKTMWRGTYDSIHNFSIFPWDSLKVWMYMMRRGVWVLIKGRR